MLRRKSNGSQNKSNWGNYNFYGTFNGKSQAFNPKVNNHNQIMEIFSTKAKQQAISKFGTTGEEVLKATGLSSELKLLAQDSKSKFVPEMMRDNDIANLMTRKAASEAARKPVNSMMQEIMQLSEADEQAAIAKLGDVNKTLKRYGNSLQDLIDMGSEIDASVGEMVVNHQESRLGDAIRLDQKSYTSALNVLEQIDFLERITSQIDRDSTKLPNFGLTGNKVSHKDKKVTKEGNEIELMKWSGAGGTYRQKAAKEKTIEKLVTNLQGSMTNYLGGIYEIAVASTLKSSFQEIFSDVQMTGADTKVPGGTSVDLSTTPLGRSLMTGTSKTDIRATLARIEDKVNVEMNLSVKNQKFNPGKKGDTKALETGLNFLINAIITQESHDSTMRTAFTNPALFGRASSMNAFLGALMADVAIAGTPGDRIDFMVYQNAIIPLSDYYKVVNRVSILPSSGNANTAANKVLTTGSTPISFRVQTKGLV